MALPVDPTLTLQQSRFRYTDPAPPMGFRVAIGAFLDRSIAARLPSFPPEGCSRYYSSVRIASSRCVSLLLSLLLVLLLLVLLVLRPLLLLAARRASASPTTTIKLLLLDCSVLLFHARTSALQLPAGPFSPAFSTLFSPRPSAHSFPSAVFNLR